MGQLRQQVRLKDGENCTTHSLPLRRSLGNQGHHYMMIIIMMMMMMNHSSKHAYSLVFSETGESARESVTSRGSGLIRYAGSVFTDWSQP